MKDAERIERAAEIIALSMMLGTKCHWECGRFASGVQSNNGDLPLCDGCRAELIAKANAEAWAYKPKFRELRQAARVRRLEALLKGEAG